MSFAFEPIWSWQWVILMAVAMVALVLLTYPRAIRNQPQKTRRFLIGLRLFAALLLLIAMLRPALQWSKTDSQKAVLYVVTDVSRSMTTPDAIASSTRREALLKILLENEKPLKSLGDKIEIRYFDFAEKLISVETPSPHAEGKETAIGAVLEELLKESQSKKVAGIVLLSDGAQRTAGKNKVDPRMMARRFAELGLPIYTIGFGGEGVTGNHIDLAVESMLVDPLVFEKKKVPIRIKLRAQGAAGRELTVKVWLEDRTGKRRGEVGEMKPLLATNESIPFRKIRPTGNNELIPIDLSFVPDLPGEFKLMVKVETIDGEAKIKNNFQETIISVQQGGIRIAYFDQVYRPEQKFIRAVNQSDKIQLDFYPIRTGRFFQSNKIDPKIFERGNYNAFIIGDVPAVTFKKELLKKLKERIDEGSGLLMTGGLNSFDAGGYAETPLAEILPIEMRKTDAQQEGNINRGLHYLKPLKIQPTRAGMNHYLMQIGSASRTKDLWKSLPDVEGANKFVQSGRLSEVLAVSTERYPLLITQKYGAGRVAVFAVDTTFLWHLGGFKNVHQRFWRQMILWLSRKETDTDQPVWVRVDSRNFSPHQKVDIEMGARNAKGKPLHDANFTVTLINPKNESQKLTSRRVNKEQIATFLNDQQPGDYWVQVGATRQGQPVGFDAWTRFIVNARDPELDNPAADLALLAEISKITGAETLLPEKFSERLGIWLKNPPGHHEITTIKRMTLWDKSTGYGYPFLCLFVAAMGLEWWLRKKRGLV
ncbi:hypothetical protein MNBD_PLANCTO02-1547 [hydrothermal vent metagenome]|uniref:Putative glutamine amidotransferase domain-containing protein n=1 Tax=hydrothermal vent metagenome TaxID=652676 RepID=A0A3B1E6C3_9ZZZZ